VSTAPKKHILFISYYFPPMGGGGVQRIQKFIKYWDYDQYNLSVLTVKPSYFYAQDPSLQNDLPDQVSVYRSGTFDPFRAIFLLKKFFRRSNSNLPKSTFESSHSSRRLINYFLLPDSRILWLPFAVQRIGKIHRSSPIDLVVATLPPFTTGMIASRAKRKWHIPYLLDFRDAWTHNLYSPRLSSIHRSIQNKFEFQTIKSARGLIFVNPYLGSFYQNKYSFLKGKRIKVIRNGFDAEDFSHLDFHKPDAQNTFFKIGIMGTIYSQGNAPITLINALSILRQKNSPLNQKLKLIFIGKWTESFYSWVMSQDIHSQVEFVPYLPHREALELARTMNALALALHSDLEGNELVTPGRIYEYLYLKKPILAMCAPKSDLAELVQNSNAGEVVDYRDTNGIVQILTRWLTTGVLSYSFKNLELFDRKLQTGELLEFIRQILAK